MKKLFIALFCVLLTACAPKIRTVIVEKNNYIPVAVSNEHFKTFQLPALVSKDVWMNSTEEGRRIILLDMISDRDAIIGQCNARILSIQKESLDIAKIVVERNKEERDKDAK